MALLQDPQCQHEFESRGYTVLRFLDDSELARLAELYTSLGFEATSGKLCSVTRERPALIRPLRDAFEEIAAVALARHFVACDVLLGNFLVKPPQPNGVVVPHQDWTVVGGGGDSAATIWMALAGVDLTSGPLGILPYSHRLFADVRYAPSAQGYKLLPYADYAMDFLPYLDLVPLQPGEAVVFHSDAIHGSLPNMSDRARVTAIFAVAVKGSPLSLHYLLPNTGLTKYESFDVDPEGFLEYHNSALQEMFDRGERPGGLASRGVFDAQPERLTPHEAIARIEAAGCRRHD